MSNSLIDREITQGVIPIGTPKAYKYDAALVEAAKASVQQGMNQLHTDGNSIISQANTILAAIRNQGGYPLKAATASAMTDTTKIYVYTGSETGYTFGHWYYHNGTAWTDGGVYNAMAFNTDPTLTISGAAADAKFTGNTIATAEKLYTQNVVQVPFTWLNYATSNTTGKPSAPSDIRLASEPVIIPPNCGVIVEKLVSQTSVTILTFDSTDTLIARSYSEAVGLIKQVDITGAKYIRVNVQYNNDSTITPADGDTIAKVTYNYVDKVDGNTVVVKTSKNLIDTTKSTIGKFISGNKGSMDDSASYDTTDYIPTNGKSVVFLMKTRKLLAYTAYKAPVPSSYVTNDQVAGYVYTPSSGEAYVRVSYYHADASEVQAEYGNTPTDYTPYQIKVEEGVHLSDTMQNDVMGLSVGNVLYGKKWVACGDSFTHGDFTDAPTDNYHIESGKYAGQYKVYPYLIGNRNGMTIVNEAQNGSTMTHIEGRSNAFIDGRYQNIPADADYITLKFGINDDADHQNVPMGTIDSTDISTFYGAYNTALSYIITNHLDAKIGIIITNGSTLDIANATIAIAEKWGVPYLNEATGIQCSYVFRSNRTDIPSPIRNAKIVNWRVSNTEGHVNAHPNAAAHEFESTVVEAWLRSL